MRVGEQEFPSAQVRHDAGGSGALGQTARARVAGQLLGQPLLRMPVSGVGPPGEPLRWGVCFSETDQGPDMGQERNRGDRPCVPAQE